MEPMSSSNPDSRSVAAAEVEGFRDSVDEISAKVNTLEKRVNEVEHYYLRKGSLQPTTSREKDRDKHFNTIKKQQQDAARREAAAAKRMRDLLNKFSAIFKQITQHKWSWPFMSPVDVESLGLHDYYQVIEKPMDLGTVQSQMETGGYKSVREIYADVRLVFKNAIKYNDDKDDVHVMAETLLEKLEEKWLQLLPKVVEEEKRQADEETQAQVDMKHAEEVAYASMAKDLSSELFEIDKYLKDLKKVVVQKCRKMSFDDKRRLGTALTQLSPEDLSKALDIVAQDNPEFQATAQEVDLDIDTQSDYTLWRLKVFVKDALKVKAQAAAQIPEAMGGNKVATSKRNREPSDAVAKPAVKRTKKISTM
ncbi:transcription factor GTE1-like [Rosa rugosa]|uniref:transcription factor GTE1-like n=1 Tax=Rosa rugosa TaxID=74645 RepID=UPI002B417427|nr:transcription factor GTE1-like [Rosa rugosa]XP_062012217.1 transcription factor GTE1-like [Rosa rugosa]